MKYVRQEPIIHTVQDEDVTDEKAIKALLQELKELNHNVFMEFEDAQNPDHMRRLESVRITAVHDENIDILAFYPNATMKFKAVSFLSIRRVRLLANKSALSQKYKGKVSRWHMMDVAEIDGM